eukprot:TRINITY_DN2249_c0_g1_i6.p2 TRINITY_DN2249_c0_g1~~TRINITY_DN2249_c0_g1_i6.p2  ORF type:complete len:225 (-),score=-5.10 TRINITY_DN2249_c0_g1_i6:1825-2499(-)
MFLRVYRNMYCTSAKCLLTTVAQRFVDVFLREVYFLSWFSRELGQLPIITEQKELIKKVVFIQLYKHLKLNNESYQSQRSAYLFDQFNVLYQNYILSATLLKVQQIEYGCYLVQTFVRMLYYKQQITTRTHTNKQLGIFSQSDSGMNIDCGCMRLYEHSYSLVFIMLECQCFFKKQCTIVTVIALSAIAEVALYFFQLSIRSYIFYFPYILYAFVCCNVCMCLY